MSNMNPIAVAYSMTNSAVNNEVVAFSQRCDGKLTRTAAYSTGGNGTGETVVDPLQSQGSVILSRDSRFLFNVNAGSNTISSFRVDEGVLTLADVEFSGGTRPVSLASFGALLYVANAGNPALDIPSNVTGFFVAEDGGLTPIANSTRPLSTDDSQPACVIFSPRGRLLIVSERTTSVLSVYEVNNDGTLDGPTVNLSNGLGPFGMVFLRKGFLLVAEAVTNALSSYTANFDETLDVVSPSVLNFQSATCWVSASPGELFAYTSNTGSRTISIYRVGDDGILTVRGISYSTPNATGAPIDTAVNRLGRFLYALNGNEGSVSVFFIERNGDLVRKQVLTATGLPAVGAQGMAVWVQPCPREDD